MSEDLQARLVLELLAGIGRCPDCGSTAPWRSYQGHKATMCQNGARYCSVVYYRPDGLCIRIGSDKCDPVTGKFEWSK